MLSTNFTTFIVVSNVKEDLEEELVDEAEYYAWNEMRLHPLLMKSIYRLEFKEPTPIQKACIPAAAHQGKVGLGSCLRWCMGVNDNKFIVFLFVYSTGCCWCCRDRVWQNTCFWFAHFAASLGGTRKGWKDAWEKGGGSRKLCSKRLFTGSHYYSYKGTCTSGTQML